jgi:hypothetical protein
MAILGSRRGAADALSIPLMILAFLVVGGFLYWLSITAEETEVEIVEGEGEEEEMIPTAATLTQSEFLGGAAEYEGQTIEVTNVRVASRLGPKAFWVGPDDNPYLVKIDEELFGPPAAEGDTARADTAAMETEEAPAEGEMAEADTAQAEERPDPTELVEVDARLNVIGTVHLMNDSVLSAWDTLGVFTNEGDRIVAEFATSFLQAIRIREGRQQAGQGGQGGQGTGGEQGEGGGG